MEGFNKLNHKLEAGVMREPAFGPIALDLKSKTLRSVESGAAEKLSDQQYQILWLLVRAQGGVISRGEIEKFLYEDLPDDKDLPLTDGLAVQLNRIKEKLARVAGDTVTIRSFKNEGIYLDSAKQ